MLTKEQKDIIKISKQIKKNEILKINACAGSGKTFTLKNITLENKNKKFLYLAFNKKIVEESRKKFPNNVDIKTIHSLAFSFFKKRFKDFKLINSYTIFDIDFLFKDKTQDEIILILKDFNSFLNSNQKTNNDLNINKIWNSILNYEIGVSHSFYLKFYQLFNNKELENQYDFLMLDEAQDANVIMLDIFLNNNCSKILVGDTFQNIYGFNNTINSLEIVKSTYDKNLSVSFRTKQNILNYADNFLEKYSNKKIKKMVSSLEEKDYDIDEETYITRTNMGIIELINDLIKNEDKIEEYSLLKDPDSIFKLIFDILNFLKSKDNLISKENQYITNFNNINELTEYANKINNLELLNAIHIIKKNYNLFTLKNIANQMYKNKNAKKFIINAHQAKGLEWDKVILYNDFTELKCIYEQIKKSNKNSDISDLINSLEQELNIFYVAITRAKYLLIDNSLNGNLKNDTIS